MKLPAIASLFLCALLFFQPIAAFETDQYNLPPQPLADIGDEVSEYVKLNLQKAIGKLNAEIQARKLCLTNQKTGVNNCGSPAEERVKLGSLRSETAPARAVYNLLGTGVPPFTSSETWMESHRFKTSPARYKTSYKYSIYFTYPANYITISSTVKIYGAQFGTDKVAHFFQQGYAYYKIYNRAPQRGNAPVEAARRAVQWGQMTERTIYGTLVSGVYSNGDLCANYAGMRFYQNLTRAVKIGDEERPAVLILKDGFWKFNENTDTSNTLVKQFFSEHFNEALNPSIYTNLFGLQAYVRRVVRRQACKEWLAAYPNLSPQDLNKTSEALKLWHGEDYGFTDSKNFVTIANTCFGGGKPSSNRDDSRFLRQR